MTQTVQEARQYLKDNWEKGVECPCCKQRVQLYERKMTWATAVVMIAMSKVDSEDGYVYLPPILNQTKTATQGGYATIAHWWGLIEKQPALREDGSNRVGYWRLTDEGKAFVTNQIKVSKVALVYNNSLYGLSGEPVSIQDVLGKRFNYNELMKG